MKMVKILILGEKVLPKRGEFIAFSAMGENRQIFTRFHIILARLQFQIKIQKLEKIHIKVKVRKSCTPSSYTQTVQICKNVEIW